MTIKQLREKIRDLEEKTESTIQVSWSSVRRIISFFSPSLQQRLKEKEKEFQRIFGRSAYSSFFLLLLLLLLPTDKRDLFD